MQNSTSGTCMETALRARDGWSFPHSFAGKLHFSALHPGCGAGFSLFPQMLWQRKKDIKCFSMTSRHASDIHETSVFSPSPSAWGCSRNFPFEAADLLRGLRRDESPL